MSIGTKKGLLFFYIHFITEVVTFYVLMQFMSLTSAAALSFLYDILAFVPQGLFGYVLDENLRYPGLILGTFFGILSLVLLYTKVTPYLIVILISVGSCFIHITGAEHTLRDGDGKMTPAALFVSGGSFGLITGKILAKYSVPAYVVLLIGLTMLLAVPYLMKHPADLRRPCDGYHLADEKMSPVLVVVLATIVVAVRAFIGYGIPTSWNKELWQTIMLYVFMGAGKALGGILIDIIGIKWTSIISTLGSLPFLIWGDNIMVLSIIGVMMFSMTMAITLGIIVSVMKRYPGIAFGMTTIGLSLGTIPLFFFKIESDAVNIILIITLTVLCLGLLLLITEKGSKLFKRSRRAES